MSAFIRLPAQGQRVAALVSDAGDARERWLFEVRGMRQMGVVYLRGFRESIAVCVFGSVYFGRNCEGDLPRWKRKAKNETSHGCYRGLFQVRPRWSSSLGKIHLILRQRAGKVFCRGASSFPEVYRDSPEENRVNKAHG
jgi:hypothetical protein